MLYWGAIDSATRFSRDYSGGWRSKVADYRRFSNNCRPYTGPPLSLLVAACDAPDGSHWALQQWQRLWQNYGGDSAAAELFISHWRKDWHALDPDRLQLSREVPAPLGQFRLPRKAVFGTHHTLQGVPTDTQGRNIYVDYLTGPVWRRVNSFLTHPPTAGFCYTFANHPAASPAWNGVGTGDAYPRRQSARGSRHSCRLTWSARSLHEAPPTMPRTPSSGRCSAATVDAASTNATDDSGKDSLVRSYTEAVRYGGSP